MDVDWCDESFQVIDDGFRSGIVLWCRIVDLFGQGYDTKEFRVRVISSHWNLG